MKPKPHVIRNQLGGGMTTWVAYGVSADVSEATRRLEVGLERLVGNVKGRGKAKR